MTRILDLTGQRFGRWVVVSRAESAKSNNTRWNCICDCGTEKRVRAGDLTQGKSTSCRCYANELTKVRSVKHGQSNTQVYSVWQAMISRTTNPTDKDYKRYLGRGITVCDRWRDYSNFLADMGERPPGLTLDRIDNDKGYYPENVRWTTHKIQSRNTSRNRLITYNGQERTLVEWAEIFKVTGDLIRGRIDRYGWTTEQALTTPVGHRRRAAA
jgi:hypothetical protein